MGNSIVLYPAANANTKFYNNYSNANISDKQSTTDLLFSNANNNHNNYLNANTSDK